MDEDRKVRSLLVSLGHDLVLGDARAAARAPRHHVVTLVNPAALVACLQEVPNRVVVLIGHRVVGVVPVHPVTEPNRLFGQALGKAPDSLHASLDELGDPVGFDVALALETELFLDFDFYPEPLAIEAVLETLLLAEHRLVALEEVLVRAAPAVMYTHRVVGRDRTVQERKPLLGLVVAVQVLLNDPVTLPPVEQHALLGREVDLGRNYFKRRHRGNSKT